MMSSRDHITSRIRNWKNNPLEYRLYANASLGIAGERYSELTGYTYRGVTTGYKLAEIVSNPKVTSGRYGLPGVGGFLGSKSFSF